MERRKSILEVMVDLAQVILLALVLFGLGFDEGLANISPWLLVGVVFLGGTERLLLGAFEAGLSALTALLLVSKTPLWLPTVLTGGLFLSNLSEMIWDYNILDLIVKVLSGNKSFRNTLRGG